jgi:hypothetical protein
MEVGLAQQRKKAKERRNKKGANGMHEQRRGREEKVRCERNDIVQSFFHGEFLILFI